MSSLNFTTYTSQIANMMPISPTDPNFLTMLPGAVDYAEQRLYRDLDLLYTQMQDSTAILSTATRNFTLPTSVGTFITCDNINITTPSSMITPTNFHRIALTPTSREFLDFAYPSGAETIGVPQFYAMASNTVAIIGPVADLPYAVDVIGIQRPAMLSAANSSTILTQYVPDLFIAASMVFVSGYMRDFGQQGDNPQMGASWEAQYQTLMKSALVEQVRAKFQSEGWTSDSPSPIATPPRV